MPQARKGIDYFPLLWQCVANAISGEKRKMEPACQFYRCLIATFVLAKKVTLQFNLEIVSAKNSAKLFDERRSSF